MNKYILLFIIFFLISILLSGCAYKDFKRAQKYEETGDYLKAAKTYQKVILKSRNSAKSYLGFSDSLYGHAIKKSSYDIFQEKDWQNALKALEISVNIKDSNSEKRKEYLLNVYKILSTIFIKSEKYEEAETFLNKAIDLKNTDADIYFNLAYIYGKKNQIEKEIEYYKKSADLNKSMAESNTNLGIIYKKLNLFDDAEKYFKNALKSDTQNFNPEMFLADLYIDKKDFAAAENILKTIDVSKIRDNSVKSDYYNKTGVIKLKQKLYLESFDDFKQAIKFNFWNVKVRINTGILFYEKGEFETSLSEFKSALEQDNMNFNIYNYIGLCFIKLGKYGDAIDNFNKSISINPLDPDSYYNLYCVYNNFLNDSNKSEYYKTKYDSLIRK
ncbi:tetratricopeptide repeat protein [Candidatus Dependentiae bacterium]|nr:tetratricopeptide repeat protein [Candidatus Dependentiae bacterium]